MCGRPYRVWASELRRPNRAKFCDRDCYFAARVAFSEALGSGLLDSFFGDKRERAKRKRAARVMDTWTSRRLITE
jgi:hypothetical protein